MAAQLFAATEEVNVVWRGFSSIRGVPVAANISAVVMRGAPHVIVVCFNPDAGEEYEFTSSCELSSNVDFRD